MLLLVVEAVQQRCLLGLVLLLSLVGEGGRLLLLEVMGVLLGIPVEVVEVVLAQARHRVRAALKVALGLVVLVLGEVQLVVVTFLLWLEEMGGTPTKVLLFSRGGQGGAVEVKVGGAGGGEEQGTTEGGALTLEMEVEVAVTQIRVLGIQRGALSHD